jgi:SAM-dependent methyltransferase
VVCHCCPSNKKTAGRGDTLRPVQRAQFELHASIERRHWWFVARRRIVLDLVRALVGPAAPLVLDVGCGTGANAAELARSLRCEGMDTSADAIELAREHWQGVRFHHADVLDPDFVLPPDLGVVLLMDVLEHIEDDVGFLRGLVARLPVGAHLVVTVPANPGLWSRHDEAFGHHRRYTAASLAAVWGDLPVEARLLSPYCTALYPAVWAVRSALRPLSAAFGEADTDFRMPPRLVNAALREIFASERGPLVALLRGETRRPLPFGSSLVAVLTRTGSQGAMP